MSGWWRFAAGACCGLAWLAIPALAVDDAEICSTCHPGAADPRMPMHPIDVPVAGRVTGSVEGLPLADGRLTCVTCHTGHGREGRNAADPDYFLRLRVPELCARCHRDAAGRWDEPHAVYADTVHGGPRFAGPEPEREGTSHPELDSVSWRCMSCHEEGGARPGIAQAAPLVAVGHSHPLSEYTFAESRRWGSYRPAAAIEPPVRLVGDRVSCASCHRVYTLRRSVLPVARRRQLCLSCHEFGPVRGEMQQARR